MQYRIPVDATPDLAALGDALLEFDPAALVDFDGDALRLSTCLDPVEFVPVLGAAGFAVEPSRVARLPSECCGGCGG